MAKVTVIIRLLFLSLIVCGLSLTCNTVSGNEGPLKNDGNILSDSFHKGYALSKKSEVLFSPVSLYHNHKYCLWSLGIILLFTITAIAALTFGFARSRNVRTALSLSEKKYRKLFETSQDAIVILNMEKGFIDCNPSALKMFAAPSKSAFCSVRPEDLSPELQPDGAISSTKIRLELTNSLKDGANFFEWQSMRFNGYEFPSTVLVVPMEIDGQTIFQGSIRDVSEKKASEKALSESGELLKLAMSVSNPGIWDWDLTTGKVIFDNRYYKMSGYEPGEFPSLVDEWRKRVHPLDIKITEKLQNNYLDGKLPHYETKFRFRKKDDSWIWIMARGKIIARNEKGDPIRFIGTHTDITELKLTEKALQRAQKMDAVGQLTGGIAHDFNNILNIIIGNLDLIRLNPNNQDKLLKWSQAAHKAAMRAGDLTRKLLGFSKLQAQYKKVLNTNNLIKGMNNLVRRSITPQVEVEYIFQNDLWLNEIDPGDFEDSLINLILNARDAMPKGGQLTIETSNIILDDVICQTISGASPGEYVQISVSDNGAGIPPELMDHIFEPFFSTKALDKGSGLGLAMVFGFVKRSDGHIKVYSEPSIGTTFRIYLPRTDKSLTMPVSSYKQSPLPRGTETILIVDDETELCRLGQTTLESLGYKVLTASDGFNALKKLKGKRKIDLLFSDIVMPGGISGYELSEKAAKLIPEIKILLTSGYSAKAVKRSPDIPFQTELLSKPYTLPVLAKKIREKLDKKSNPIISGNKSPKLIIWSDKFSIGIDEIDNDHKQLIGLYNKCRKISGTGNKKKVDEVLDSIITYTEQHFAREEKVMEMCEYPQLKNHVQVHKLLRKESIENKKRFDQHDIDVNTILDFLTDWLLGHIHGMDRSITPYTMGLKKKINAFLIQNQNNGENE